MTPPKAPTRVRPMETRDFEGIIELCRRVYPESRPWTGVQLESHLHVFSEGQFVAERDGRPGISGMAAGLILRWDDYVSTGTWRDFTDSGMFTNHDPAGGRTLYGAEVMVDPAIQRSGVGAALYRARQELAVRLGLRRIRAAARLRGYHRHARQMGPETYVQRIVRGEMKDPTLSFQLSRGFEVIQVVSGYLKSDPESLGFAAVVEWLNPAMAAEADLSGRDPRYLSPPRPPDAAPGR